MVCDRSLCLTLIIIQSRLVTDRRTYKDRRDVWATEKKKAEFVAERPKARIRHNTPPPEENPLRKNKAAPAAAAGQADSHEEEQEELVMNELILRF